MRLFRIRKVGIAVVVLSSLYFSSCEKDESSPQSTSDDRDKFIRSWTCNETSQQQGTSTYTITISEDNTSANTIITKNFYNLGPTTNTMMIVDGNNVTINSQNISGHIISGSGTYHSTNSLTFSFTVDDGQSIDNVTISAH